MDGNTQEAQELCWMIWTKQLLSPLFVSGSTGSNILEGFLGEKRFTITIEEVNHDSQA